MLALLRKQFGDCKRLASSECPIRSSYEEHDAEEFYVYDPLPPSLQPVQVVTSDQDFQLIVNNPSKEHICLVKTDKCLFTDDIQKCDCILFNGRKVFLVEIKSTTPAGRSNARRRAAAQLESTIIALSDAGIDLTNYESSAIICFKRNVQYPVRASSNTQRAVFLHKYKVSLDEANFIRF